MLTRTLALIALAFTPALRAADEPAVLDAPAAVPATDPVLAAARVASDAWQRHLSLTWDDFSSPDQATRIAAIRELARLDIVEAAPQLIELADGYRQPPEIVMAACESLADLQIMNAMGVLQKLLVHADPRVRACAQKNLTRIQGMAAPQYQKQSGDQDDALRASAVTNLGTMQLAEAGPILVNALRFDSRPHIRRMAAIGLGQLGDKRFASQLMESLCDADPRVRGYAAASLAHLGATDAVPNLLMALEANVAPTRIHAALMKLTGQDFGFDPRANAVERQHAIDQGFEWWSLHAKEFAAK